MYVLSVDAASRKVIVGPKEALARRYVHIQDVNWLGDEPLGTAPVAAGVKLRSTMPAVRAQLHSDGAGGAHVVLDEPEFGIAPGQACVAYAGTRVLGGGWIVSTAGHPPV